jgi:hypothetical protein
MGDATLTHSAPFAPVVRSYEFVPLREGEDAYDYTSVQSPPAPGFKP